MKNLLKTNWVANMVVRYTLASCVGVFMGSATSLVIKNEQKIGDKIVVAAGGVVTAWIVGKGLDAPFNKMLEEGLDELRAEETEQEQFEDPVMDCE